MRTVFMISTLTLTLPVLPLHNRNFVSSPRSPGELEIEAFKFWQGLVFRIIHIHDTRRMTST